jgi:CubicO group peptidase (beta-lactamase class C family)
VFGDGSLVGRAMMLPAGTAGSLDEFLNTPAGHQTEVPAVSGVMTARDLARFYGCLANYGELDGVRILSEATVREMSVMRTRRPDKVIMGIPVGWSLGYMNGGAEGWPQGPRETSFGHPGLGGSVGFADPEIGLSFGFVTNALAMDLIGAGRTAQLAEAARGCAEAIESVAT